MLSWGWLQAFPSSNHIPRYRKENEKTEHLDVSRFNDKGNDQNQCRADQKKHWLGKLFENYPAKMGEAHMTDHEGNGQHGNDP